MEDGNFLDASNPCFQGDFDTQVVQILQNIRMSKAEVENLTHLFNDVENTLRCIWTGCQVHPFGSIVTGLGIWTSDVDCYVSIPSALQQPERLVIQARNVLKSNWDIFSNLIAITRAKVPIVKLFHIPTRRNCDISFTSPSGVRNSKLLACLLHMDPRVLPLAILIKYWSKFWKFTGTNLMSNYALTMMVIFYLQQKNILPTIAQMQRNSDDYYVDIWNTGFDGGYEHPLMNKETLFEITGGFFKFYSSFGFEENIISPFLGYVVRRNSFKNLYTVHSDYALYKHNVMTKCCQPLRLDTAICVQDPFDHSRNCTVAIHQRLMAQIRAHFKFAAKMYEEKCSEDFLKAILTNDSKMPSPEYSIYPTRITIKGPVNKPEPKHTALVKSKNKPRRKRNKKTATLILGELRRTEKTTR